jgi:uncharacterized lipoprotein YajG
MRVSNNSIWHSAARNAHGGESGAVSPALSAKQQQACHATAALAALASGIMATSCSAAWHAARVTPRNALAARDARRRRRQIDIEQRRRRLQKNLGCVCAGGAVWRKAAARRWRKRW